MVILFLLSSHDWKTNNQIEQLVNNEQVQPIDLTDLELDQPEALKKLDSYMSTAKYTRTIVWLGGDLLTKPDIRKWLNNKYNVYSNVATI